MDKAKLERLRYSARAVGLRICKLKNENAFILTRNDGQFVPLAKGVLNFKELEKVLADIAEVAAD